MYNVMPVTSDKETNCGATCLKMLLGFYGIDVDLDTLIKDCNTRLIGCTGKDMLRAGRKHGLDMTAWKMDGDEVSIQDRPSIIWWNYNHWVVCCGLDDNGNVVICNPSRGRFPLDIGTFMSRYSGVALFNGEPQNIEGATV